MKRRRFFASLLPTAAAILIGLNVTLGSIREPIRSRMNPKDLSTLSELLKQVYDPVMDEVLMQPFSVRDFEEPTRSGWVFESRGH